MKNIFPITLIKLDRASSTPLYQQIANELRQAILIKKIAPGARLPSHRDLAKMLNISRNTAVSAIDLLVSEGYIVPRVGAGCFITDELPEEFLQSVTPEKTQKYTRTVDPGLSPQGKMLTSDFNPVWQLPARSKHNLFRNGLPDMHAFPFNIWEKISRKYLYYQPDVIFDFNPDPAGHLPLRQALSNYLNIARAINSSAEQIMMITATEQVVYLAARLLTEPGDKVWVEEPGFPGAARAFRAAGAEVIPVPVDENGLNVEQAMQIAPDAKLVYVSPSHQFPIGSTLSLKRRLELLTWAENNQAWIIEDDYDSEYRYNERPLPALQGLDKHGRVIYCGTFNLTLFPGIRLDYTVLPENLFEAFLAARSIIDIHISTQNQAIIADFITEGHFARHIRRMRKHYYQRRDALIDAVQSQASNLLTLGMANCGVYTCAFLPQHVDDEAVYQQASKQGIEALPLSRFYYGDQKQMGLVLGFAACEPKDIRTGITQLFKIVTALDLKYP